MMRIPPYWAKETHTGTDHKGKRRTFAACGWSFESLAAAKNDALARARRIFDRLASGVRTDTYDYLEHPLREEIVETIGRDGDPIAVITRNRYGALVLNSASVCFVDVDFPPARPQGFLADLLSIFSKNRREQRTQAVEEETLRRISGWAGDHPDRSFRLYRTRAGLRLLFTDRLYQPTSEETARLLRDLGSDEMYRKLTSKQACFRARLTSKPWRCGCRRPPNRYPWDNVEAENAYRHWQRDYEHKCARFASCRLVENFGDHDLDEPIAAIIEVHDRYACGDEQAILA